MLENEKWDRQIKNSKKPPQRPTRYIFGILACCLCMVIFITSVYAAHQQNIGTNFNIQYVDPNAPPKPTLDKLRFWYAKEENSGSVYISVGQWDENVSGDIVIPSTWDSDGRELPVQGIGGDAYNGEQIDAFADNLNITSVYIPESIKYIDTISFLHCSNIEQIYYNAENAEDTPVDGGGNAPFVGACMEVPDSTIIIGPKVTRIPAFLFFYCAAANLTIPSNVTSIGQLAFAACGELTTINYNANVPDFSTEEIELGGPFASACEAVPEATVIIGDDVTHIPAYLFYMACMSSITIGKNVESIGESAFAECYHLEEIILDSPQIYSLLTDENACGGMLSNFSFGGAVKVLKSADDGSNTYLDNASKFTKSTQTIDDKQYNVYTKK